MIDKGLSERRSLRVVGMSASTYRYQTRPDRNVALRRRIVELAQRHKRYGVGMIHLKLRQEGGEPVNYKRVERLYREERLQVRRRKRKKVPVSERQPMYGYQIAKRLEEVGEGVLAGKQSALYPVLRNLEGAGLLASEVESSVSGPPRRYYRITKPGREVLREWVAAWTATRDSVDNVLQGGV